MIINLTLGVLAVVSGVVLFFMSLNSAGPTLSVLLGVGGAFMILAGAHSIWSTSKRNGRQ